MPQNKLFAFVAALSLLDYVIAQQSCVNTCTGSANVLTQLKTCSGCGTDDWACFCRCPQYINALFSCVQQNCEGSAVENSIVSFCSSQGVSISYSSGSVSVGSTTASASSTSSSGTIPTTLSTSGTVIGGGLPLSSITSGLSTTSGSSATSRPSATPSSSFTATDSSAISSYLATALPASARTESSDACFVNTPYSYYSTPTWYSTLPTQAQSYYSSINQGNTAACTLSPAAVAGSNSGHHGLSAGAIAGIVVGALLAALLLALLLFCCCFRRRRRQRRDVTAAGARNRGPLTMQPGIYGNEKGVANIPGQARQAPYDNRTGLGGAAPVANGRTVQAPYHRSDGLVGLAPLANGRGAQAPYAHGGSNGFAAGPTGNAGHQMPYGAGGGLGGPGADGASPDPSHTTSTTTRVTIRSRP